MAPRGGSHSSSGGSGSTDDGSGSGADSSAWLASSDLYGFANGYVYASIAFNGLWMVALFAVAIWAMGIGRKGEVSHSVLGWKKYGIAITLMLM